MANRAGHIITAQECCAGNLKGEKVAEVGALGLREVSIGCGLVIMTGKIHVDSGSRPISQSEIECETALENPPVRGRSEHSRKQALERHKLSEARETGTRRPRLR